MLISFSSPHPGNLPRRPAPGQELQDQQIWAELLAKVILGPGGARWPARVTEVQQLVTWRIVTWHQTLPYSFVLFQITGKCAFGDSTLNDNELLNVKEVKRGATFTSLVEANQAI